jgi:hypothetical protein
VAKEKELNFAVAITVQPEHEQANNETQADVDASKDQGRPAW